MMYADLHCHPSMKPFSVSPDGHNSENFRDKKSIWNSDPRIRVAVEQFIEKIIPVAKYKQADFYTAVRGNVNLIFLSITPPEIDFLKIRGISLIQILKKTIGVFIPNFVTEFGARRIKKIKGIGPEKYDYFKELVIEYEYIKELDNKEIYVEGEKMKYVIIKNYDQLQEIKNEEATGKSIAIILTIEGGHALVSGVAHNVFRRYSIDKLNDLDDEATKELLRSINENIIQVKNWGPSESQKGDHCPLFLTFDHHFWNMLSGHAPSIPGILNKLLNQTENINTGMTELGKKVLLSLLSKENGKRILIDTKHMSAATRIWFYNYIKEYNEEHPDDIIPVISSHTGANDIEKIENSDKNEVKNKKFLFLKWKKIIADKKYKKSDELNNWSINLSNEEIKNIHDSGGLIGISLDQRIIGGKNTVDYVKKKKKKDPDYYFEWARLVYNQLAHIFKIIHDHRLHQYPNESEKERAEKSVENIMIGSDFDGIINPVDGFRTFNSYDSLEDQLKRHIDENEPLFHGMSSKQLVRNVMFGNVVAFLEKYF